MRTISTYGVISKYGHTVQLSLNILLNSSSYLFEPVMTMLSKRKPKLLALAAP